MSLFCLLIGFSKRYSAFNPDILGQPTSTAIKILQDKKPDDIEPVNVLVDIKDGKYNAASVFIPKSNLCGSERITE